MEFKILSSLEKVFLDEEPKGAEIKNLSALKGERVSFQIAYKYDQWKIWTRVKAISEVGEVKVYEVKSIPVSYPAYPDMLDDDYLRTKPGLFPDLLASVEDRFVITSNRWSTLFVSVDIPENAVAGESTVRVELYSEETDELLCEASLNIEVIDAVLPEMTLLYTNWFHVDCLATYYKVPVFSEEHWEIIDKFMHTAHSDCGMNMILTPVFTPPLDTKVGGERPTVQLVGVEKDGEKYTFDFSLLERYMSMAEKNGIENFEISHLFTQWGAKFCPKIVAKEQGELKKIFGWETSATSDEYKTFLKSFLRELKDFIYETDREKKCYFHISDEPSLDHLESYNAAKEIVAGELRDFPIIDALSNYDFYERGIVEKPIPSSDHIEKFLENKVPGLWTYYCCVQTQNVSNRFVSMPSYRNRILGYQLFKFDIKGFLHWGYNFWYGQYSVCEIDPFAETGALDAFPAGDAYLVYPGKNGEPMHSLRQKVFYEGLQDMRALRLLESLSSKEEAIRIIDEEGEITFSEYPRSAEWTICKRERINQKIKELVK